MKKILFVIPALTSGGAEKSLVNLLNILDSSRYEIDLLLFRKEGVFLEQLPSYVNIMSIPSDLYYCYNSKRPKNVRSAFIMVVRYLGTAVTGMIIHNRYQQREKRWNFFYKHIIRNLKQEYDFAVAYLHGEPTYFVIDKVKAKRKIVWVHNDYRELHASNTFQKIYFKKADYVVTISEECKKSLDQEFPFFQDKFVILPNLTSNILTKKLADEFVPSEYNQGGKIFLSIGRLSRQKGFDFAVAAAGILKQKGVRFQWFIIGEGELRDHLEKEIQEIDVQDCFTLLGVRSNPYPYIKNCDVLVQTSRFEGKSVVLDEAKVLAKPILSTRYPTVFEQVIDGVEGMVVDMTSEAIAEGLFELINNKVLSKRFETYLENHEYGNQMDVEKYYSYIEG